VEGLRKDCERVANCRIKVSQRVVSASAASCNEALRKDLVSDDIPTVPIVHFARHIPAACAEGGVRAERNRARWPVTFECGSPLLHVATLADASQEASSALGYESEITVGSRLPSHCPAAKICPSMSSKHRPITVQAIHGFVRSLAGVVQGTGVV
jgi:hypothetical protein